ncbi:MAG: C-GCAxxG-C-C family protein [Solirubrobacteraceae bacterium]
MSVEAFPTIPADELRRRGVGNLLRMGHCAPTVMQTMLDASDTEADWLVLLTAGLPGGIANTGGECGGLTAPLVLMGLRHRRDETADGLPRVVDEGDDLMRRFRDRHGTTDCRQILGNARVPVRCVGVVREAPAMCAHCLAAGGRRAIEPNRRAAYRELHAHWRQRGFHCADAVLAELDTPAGIDGATAAFLGGTLFAGMTCSALTAGVMALGLRFGEMEDSRPRVARMLGLMALGKDALADQVNAFNHAMNLGHDLAGWFEAQFGSTQCRALTGCDFATADGVAAYIEHDGTTSCARIARLVAQRVADMVAEPS